MMNQHKANTRERYLRITKQWLPGIECLTDQEFRHVLLAWVDYATIDDNSAVGKNLTRVEFAAFAGRVGDIDYIRNLSDIRSRVGHNGGTTTQRLKQNIATPSKAKQNEATSTYQSSQSQSKSSQDQTTTALPRGKQPPTIDQFVDGGKAAGVPEDFARSFYADLVAAGWQDADGQRVGNWRRYLKSAWLGEQKKISGARAECSISGIALDDIPDVR